MELAPMPVREAEGVDVRLEERDPPGVDAARAVVVVVCPALAVVEERPVLLPAEVLVVDDPAPGLAAVVLVVVELELVL